MPEVVLDKEKPHYAGHRARLRERFLEKGASALAEYELLELLLFAAHPRGDTKPLAKMLLARFGTLSALLHADIDTLSEVEGLGESAIVALKAIHAACELTLKQDVMGKQTLSSWTALLDYCRVSMGSLKVEQFRVLFLNKKNELLGEEILQEGTVDHASVYPRELIKHALAAGATAIILVHNHPSGDPKPSKADVEMTRHIAEIGKLLGIALHDHIVIGGKGHYSFKSNGLL